MRIDSRGNAVFPHFDLDGLCGYEIKNRGFTGFARGGAKGLWLSNAQDGDNRLIFAESAIDALSHAALFTSRTNSSDGQILKPTSMLAAMRSIGMISVIVFDGCFDLGVKGGVNGSSPLCQQPMPVV